KEEAGTTDGEKEQLKGTKLVAAVLNAIVKTVVVKAKLRSGATLKTFDSFDIMFNSDMLQAVVALFSDNSVNLSRFNLDESTSGLFLKLADDDFDGKPSISVGMQTADGLKLKLALAAAFTIDIGATTSILGVGVTPNDFADLSKFKSQTYNLSVDGKLYVGADGSASYDLSQFLNSSDMLAKYFGDMVVSLMADQQFYSAVGVRIGANFNLGDLFLDYFTANGYELISDWEARAENAGRKYKGTKYSKVEKVDENGKVIETTYEEDKENGIYKKQYSILDFLNKSELRSLEISLELLELDTYGNYKYDSEGNAIVKGGLYLAQDTLYLDGRKLFPGAPAAYIPHIVSVIENVIKGLDKADDTLGDIVDKTGGISSGIKANAEALTSDGTANAANQAILELIISDPAIQLVLTKSFFAVILSMIMPTLGDIGDIFDVLNLSLSLDKGKFSHELIDYSEICKDQRFSRSYEEISDMIDVLTNATNNYAYDKANNKYVMISSIAVCDAEGVTGSGDYYIVNGDASLIYLASEFKYYKRHAIDTNVYYENENGEFEVSGGLYYEKLDWSEDLLKDENKNLRYTMGYYAYGTGLEKEVDYVASAIIPANLYFIVKGSDGLYYNVSTHSRYNDENGTVANADTGKYVAIGSEYVALNLTNTIGRYVKIGDTYYDLTNYVTGVNGVASIDINGTAVELSSAQTYNYGWHQNDTGLYAKADKFDVVSNQAFRAIYVGSDGIESDWSADRYGYGYFANASIASKNAVTDANNTDVFYFSYNNVVYNLNNYIWYSDETGSTVIPISQRTAANVENVKCVNLTDIGQKVKVSDFDTVAKLQANEEVYKISGTEGDYKYFFFKGYYKAEKGEYKWVAAEYSLVLPYEERYTEITYFREYESGDYIFDNSNVEYYVELASRNESGVRNTITKSAYAALSETEQAKYGAIGSFVLYDNLTAEKKEQFAASTRYQKVSDYYLFSYLVAHADELYVQDINGYYGKTANADGTAVYEKFDSSKHTLRYSKAVNNVIVKTEAEANVGRQDYEEKIVGTYVKYQGNEDKLAAYENIAVEIGGEKYVIYSVLTDELKAALSSMRYVAILDVFTYDADETYTYPAYVAYDEFKDYKLTADKYLSELIGSADRSAFMENYWWVNTADGYVKWNELSPQQQTSYVDRVKYVLDYSVKGSKYDLRNDGSKTYGSYTLDITQSEYMRKAIKYTSISDFGITLGVKAGTFGFGVSIGGLNIGFGSTASLLPKDINEAIPFTESTVGASVDVRLHGEFTAGTVDLGRVFSGIVGDISGVVVEVPEYTVGVTKMDFRMSVSALLDFSDLSKSELKAELIDISAVDVEEVFIGVYYQDGCLYVNAEKLGLPKTVINELDFITDTLNDLLVKIFGDDVYNSEQIQNEAGGADVYNVALQILLSNKHFSVRIGKQLIDFALGLVKFGDVTLKDFIYEGIDYSGFADVKVSLDDLEATEIGAEISFRMPAGSKYVQVKIENLFDSENNLTEEAKTAIKEAQLANGLKEDVAKEKLMLFIEDPDGIWAFDSAKNIFVRGTAITSSRRFTPYAYGTTEFNAALQTAEKDGLKTIYYILVEGESANYDTYAKEVNFSLGINNVSLKFSQTDRTRPLTDDAIKDYTLYSEIENVVIEERIDVTTYLAGGDLDLSEWVQLFFQDESLADLEGIIKVMDEKGDYLNRKTYLDMKIDIKLASIINSIRKTILDKEIAGTTEDSEKKPTWREGDLDLKLLFDTLKGGGIDIVKILSLVNAEFKIVTQGSSYDASTGQTVTTEENTLVKMYFAGGNYSLVCDYVTIDGYYEFINLEKATEENKAKYEWVEGYDISSQPFDKNKLVRYRYDDIEKQYVSGTGAEYGLIKYFPYKGDTKSFTGIRYSKNYKGYYTDAAGKYMAVVDHEKLGNMASKDKWSHYFVNPYGDYAYDILNKEFFNFKELQRQYAAEGKTLDLSDTDRYSTDRYSYDPVNYYQNEYGVYSFVPGGLNIDLTGVGLAAYTVDSFTLTEIGNKLFNKDKNSEASTTDDTNGGDNTGDGSDNKTGSKISLPLLPDNICEYIRAFLYGMQVTSNYISIMLHANYLNVIADLVTGEDTSFSFDFDFNKRSYLRINTDAKRYRFDSLVTNDANTDLDASGNTDVNGGVRLSTNPTEILTDEFGAQITYEQFVTDESRLVYAILPRTGDKGNYVFIDKNTKLVKFTAEEKAHIT
ncbi:MAG: hypothetical protein MRZ86_00990, partial [Acidaminococcus sp.]|nr:hypothetical protein [Acidaminococcus sp.]